MAFSAATILACSGNTQTTPTIDTEDGTLDAVTVNSGDIHPIISLDFRNGDFARGNYDDDRADVGRLPAHVQVGISADLHHHPDGKADFWLVIRSSNGIHAPSREEKTRPRSWYESNNLIGLVVAPFVGLRAAAIYTIKASPNGISNTTHEASLSFAYDSVSGLGLLQPTFVATVRSKGDHGLYTQIGIEPRISAAGDGKAKLSLPATFGVGWSGFYGVRSGDRLYGSAGLALSKPFTIAKTKWSARVEMLALVRDGPLARLSGPDGETDTVVPLATIGLSVAY